MNGQYRLTAAKMLLNIDHKTTTTRKKGSKCESAAHHYGFERDLHQQCVLNANKPRARHPKWTNMVDRTLVSYLLSLKLRWFFYSLHICTLYICSFDQMGILYEKVWLVIFVFTQSLGILSRSPNATINEAMKIDYLMNTRPILPRNLA